MQVNSCLTRKLIFLHERRVCHSLQLFFLTTPSWNHLGWQTMPETRSGKTKQKAQRPSRWSFLSFHNVDSPSVWILFTLLILSNLIPCTVFTLGVLLIVQCHNEQCSSPLSRSAEVSVWGWVNIHYYFWSYLQPVGRESVWHILLKTWLPAKTIIRLLFC